MTWMTPHAPYIMENPRWARLARSGHFKIFLLIYAIAHALLIVDLEVARTELFTPLNLPAIICSEWLAAGITTLTGLMIVLDHVRSGANGRLLRVIGSLIVLGPLAAASAMLWGHFAWRAEEVWAFKKVDPDMHNWDMRVANLQVMGKGNQPVAMIRRWAGDPLFMPISNADFDRFPDRHLHNIDICYPVLYQQVGKAIRIWRPGQPSPGELRLKACPPQVHTRQSL